MNITVQKEDILPSLALIQNIVEKKTSLPILSHVYIETATDHVTLQASDLELGVRRKCAVIVEQAGACTADARKLYEIIRALSSGSLSLKLAKNGWLEVKQGKSRFTLPTLDPKEFPSFSVPPSNVHTIHMPTSLLKEMIEKTLFAVATDEFRPGLSGTLLEVNEGEKLRIVATDGHRLSLIERPVSDLPSPFPQTILPRKGLTEARKIIELEKEEKATLFISETPALVTLILGSTEFSMRPIDGAFPDYQQVIPREKTHTFSLQREELLEAVKRLLILTSERARGIKLDVGAEKIELSVNNPDLGEGIEEVPGQNGNEKGITTGFNGRYLLDVLSALNGERITLELNDEVSPGVIRVEGDEGYLYVVMPMRIF